MLSFKEWMKLDESQFKGNVGLWWADGKTIYVFMHEVEDGKNFEGNIHTVSNHQKAWKSVVLRHRPDLNSFSFTYLPRGRIYFNKEKHKFFVVGTPSLLSKHKFIDALKKEFQVDDLHVSAEVDHHYQDSMGADIMTTLKTISAWS